MVKMLRIDDRLLHGQVCFVWTKHLGVNAIIVANDKVIDDEIQMMSLKMACPEGIKLAVKSVEDAVKLLNDPRAQNMKIFVIVRNPQDALRIAKKVSSIPIINIGNYGRIKQNDERKEMLTSDIYTSQNDRKCLREIVDTGIRFEAQPVPTSAAKLVKDLL